MAAEYLMEFIVSFMVEADGEQAAAEIAGAFVNTAIEVALSERDGDIRRATPAEQDGLWWPALVQFVPSGRLHRAGRVPPRAPGS